MRMRPALPLSLQLLLTFVSLLIGMAAVLTTAAHSSLRDSLEEDARSSVAIATRTREQAITRLFELRQQRAEAFLVSIPALCSEEVDAKRTIWLPECTRTMVDDFRRGERAIGAQLDHDTRGRLRRSGARITAPAPDLGSRARVVRELDGSVTFVMRAERGDLSLTLQFDDQQITDLFSESPGVGRGGELALVDAAGRVIAPRHLASAAAADAAGWLVDKCRTDTDSLMGPDARGIEAIQSFRPVAVLGGACVMAHVNRADVVAPAETLKAHLITRGSWFVVVGALLSLIAAQWIAAPVRRLAASARRMQSGRFDRPIPLAGPSETRALGSAFNAMGNDLAEMVAKEQSARREAEAANRAKDDFLATVSHELRTPLTAILGWAHMLQSERLPPDRVKHAVTVIERAARAQRQLIEDLLDVSRIASNRLQIAREPVRLGEIVEAALDTVRPQAADAQITIETDLAASAVVLGDARRLEQIVWNLAWNAVKFTQPSGRITVKLAEADGHAVLSVADTGIGIPSVFLPQIFEWFRQGETRAGSQAGLGLGLGLVRQLVRLHGGSVTAQSAGEGRGATFVVRLPLHVAPAAPALEARRPAVPRLTDRRLAAIRILVVEDDDDTRELVRVTLENAGASVDAVASAREARREIEADAPDVLISDIRMPEEDGYSLIRSLRTAGNETPAIALTALARREDAEEARAAGFQAHIAKPVDSTGLIDAVASVVRQPTVH
jgi:signal transduction histidine kinase/CheY-like chemotaxis protein